MSDKAIKSTTQEFLDVYDIANDMVLLKDGTVSIILQIGTMNFSLLAEEEQDAVIFTYGSLLNSLNYPIQINIQSQTKDATKYLRLLDEQITKTNSGQKAILIRQYRDFVAALIKERNVLQKRFYVVVPASPGEMGLITPSNVLPGKTNFDINSVEKSVLIEKALNLLEPRRDHLTSQFNRLGLYVRQLDTQEIIQNFYINYNPEAVEGQEVGGSENYTTPLVRASFGGKFMQSNNQAYDQLSNVGGANNLTQTQGATPEQITQNQAPITQNQAPATQETTTVQGPISTIQGPTPEEILRNQPLEETLPTDSAFSTNSAQTVNSTPPDFIAQTVDDIQSYIGEKPAVSEETQPVGEEAQPIAGEARAVAEEIQPVAEEIQPIAGAEMPDSTPIDNVATNTNSINEVAQVFAPTSSSNLEQPSSNQLSSEQFTQQPSSEINLNLDPNLINTVADDKSFNKASGVNNATPSETSSRVADASQVFTEDIAPLQNKFENETKTDQTQKQTQMQDQTIKSEI